MKTLMRFLLFLCFVALFVLPTLAQWRWYYPGNAYTAPESEPLETLKIEPAEIDYRPTDDRLIVGEGRVLIDFSHSNYLRVDDLTPLRDRLTSRGVRLQNVDGVDVELIQALRGATGLVVLAPASDFSDSEREAISDFVDDGGRLLIAADPTRPAYPQSPEEAFSLDDFFFPLSAIPAVNSLAHEFGLIFYDDYLYNLNDNEGNYRNIRLSPSASSDLVTGLDEIVFFAAHSIETTGEPLLLSDENTRSPLRLGETNLATAALVRDDHVLALGDMTFFTPGYYNIADNNAFLNRIADWLAQDLRERSLEDFPFLFEGEVDLIQAAEGYLDTRLIARSGELQAYFEDANLKLTLRSEVQPDHNAIFISTFDDLDMVESYLITAGITVTLIVAEEQDEAETAEDDLGEDEPTDPLETDELELGETENDDLAGDDTDTPEISEDPGVDESDETLTLEADTDLGDDETVPGEEGDLEFDDLEIMDDSATEDESELETVVEISGLGTIGVNGTSLFVVNYDHDRISLIALAEDGTTAIAALERLAQGDFSGCLLDTNMTICSTGETQIGSGLENKNEESEDVPLDDEDVPLDDEDAPLDDEDASEDEGLTERIFILAGDAAPEGTRTSAGDLAAILDDFYDITLWSIADQGIPDDEALSDYAAFILDFGDYAFDGENLEILDATLLFFDQPQGTMILGTQPFPPFDEDEIATPVADLQLITSDHPLAFGFEADQIIDLAASESGVPAMVLPESIIEEPDTDIIFARGPQSEFAGRPILVATEDSDGSRGVIGTFAFYRLPEAIQFDLALNAALWLLGDE